MARKEKVILMDGIDKREVGYYSTPPFVADYLAKEMLRISPIGKYVLDPAVGKEELLSLFHKNGKKIESFDVIDYGNHHFSSFQQLNFIDYYANVKKDTLHGNAISTKYDYIIANPPYNCHEISYIKDNKKWLNSLFDVGAYNMYSMFLSAMIDIAKDGCVIGVVICDSFLTSCVHNKLREQIFKTCSIHQIILCPTDLFWTQKADVRTCIMILQKGLQYQGKVKIANRPSNSKELESVLSEKKFKEIDIEKLKLSKEVSLNQILIDVDNSIVRLFSAYPALGDSYKCVTCISTGNDKKYLSKSPQQGYSVPFYKNPASRKFKSTADAYLIDDYLEESLKVKDFIVRNKMLLHNEGIACSSMGLPFSAAYLPKEAVTGVNPTIFPPLRDIFWLLAYLNSSLATYLVRGVLIRSNMVTSGYINHLPILPFSDKEKTELGRISKSVLHDDCSITEAIKEIDTLIFNKGILPKNIVAKIKEFSSNLTNHV